MLERLGHDALVGIDDQQQELHAGRARKHVVQEALVSGNVDDAAFHAVVEAQVRETEVEGHAAQLLFDQTVGVGSGERGDQRRLSVIDVPGRPDDVHGGLSGLFVRIPYSARISSAARKPDSAPPSMKP